MRIILLMVLLAFCPILASAESLLSQRSVVRPGLWYDTAHVGNGFDVHLVDQSVFVIWYSFRTDGTPIWYTAQGQFNSNQQLHADLLQFRWQNNRVSSPQIVGQITLIRAHAEAIRLQWRLGNTQGDWQLRPLELPGNRVERDASGLFFDPQQTGFGLSWLERQDSSAAAYYFYDALGEPTWALGQPSGTDYKQLTFRLFSGACPSCEHHAPQVQGEFSGSVNNTNERQLQLSISNNATAVGAPWSQPSRILVQLSRTMSERAADYQMARVDSSHAFVELMRRALANPPLDFAALLPNQNDDPVELHVVSPFIPGGVPVSAPPDHSPVPTPMPIINNQEIGIDESDWLKHDGEYAYAFDLDGAELRAFDLNDEHRSHRFTAQFPHVNQKQDQRRMYLGQQDLIVVTSQERSAQVSTAFASRHQTYVEIFDRTDKLRPQRRYWGFFDGSLVSSRRVGDQLLLVLRANPFIPTLNTNPRNQSEIDRNNSVLRNYRLDQLMPSRSDSFGADQWLSSATSMLVPPLGGRALNPEFTILVRINLDNPRDQDSLAMVGKADAIYVSDQNVYLVSSRQAPDVRVANGENTVDWSTVSETEIHQINYRSGPIRAVATGYVPGYLDANMQRAPFRFSEQNGMLRVLSQTTQTTALGRNRLSVMRPSEAMPGMLLTVAQLPNASVPAPIGGVGDDLSTVRFVGDRLYLSSAQLEREVDSDQAIDRVEVIDLSNQLQPMTLGQLRLPGHVRYWHPVADDLLLAFGKDARFDNRVANPWDMRYRGAWSKGLQVLAIDVRNVSTPRLLHRSIIGMRGSQSIIHDNHLALSLLRIENGWRMAWPIRVHDIRLNSPIWMNCNLTYAACVSAFRGHQFGMLQMHRSSDGQWLFESKSSWASNTRLTGDREEFDRVILHGDKVHYIHDNRLRTASWSNPQAVTTARQ